MAITSLRRVGDLQALSISNGCLEFAPGNIKAILHPRLGSDVGWGPSYQGPRSRKSAMQQDGPPLTLLLDFTAWTFHRHLAPSCSRPKCACAQLHTRTGRARCGIVGTRSPKVSFDAVRVPSKGNVSGYDCNPCSLRRERDAATKTTLGNASSVTASEARVELVPSRLVFMMS